MCALDVDGGARGGVGQGVSGGVTDTLTAVKSWNWTNGFLSTTVFFVLRCKKKSDATNNTSDTSVHI